MNLGTPKSNVELIFVFPLPFFLSSSLRAAPRCWQRLFCPSRAEEQTLVSLGCERGVLGLTLGALLLVLPLGASQHLLSAAVTG